MNPSTVPVTPQPSRPEVAVWRYALAAGGVLALGLVVLARMVLLQTGPERNWLARGVREGYAESVPLPRGLIYDSEGYLLAGDRPAYELDVRLGAVPAEALPQIARDVAAVLGLDEKALQEALIANKAKQVAAVLVSNRVSEQQKTLLEARSRAWQVKGADGKPQPVRDALTFVRRLVRYYPEGDLAANVLGFVAIASGDGYGGVEQYYNDLLKGGVTWVEYPYAPWQQDDQQRSVPRQPVALYLTIDRTLQRAAEEEAWRAVQQSKADSATIIVADPYTGALLAVGQYPRPNLNNYHAIQEHLKKWDALDFAVERSYEPGSVFKIVTMASAVDAGKVTPKTVFHDVGTFEVPGRTVWNWNRGAWGDQTMVGCLQHSLNTCLAWVAVKRLGKLPFYDYLKAFGFGRPTGVDLGGELSGYYRTPGGKYWSHSDWASQAFGQAIDVTPMQMVAAASAIANGGYLVTPHVLRYEVVNGRAYPYRADAPLQVISADASRTMRQMLTESLKGESSAALVEGYSVAGKTGTAEIAVKGAGYVTHATNASFVGWFPADKPQYVIYVWLERPKTSIWASIVAAPVFANMVQRVAAIEHVPPDSVRKQLSAAEAQQP